MQWVVVLGRKGRPKTSLIQICLNTEICYLFHVFHIQKLPEAFIKLMTHNNVVMHSNSITKYIFIYLNLKQGECEIFQNDFLKNFMKSWKTITMLPTGNKCANVVVTNFPMHFGKSHIDLFYVTLIQYSYI